MDIHKLDNLVSSPEFKIFITKVVPDLVKELSKFNYNFERALDYYALEIYGKVPRANNNDRKGDS